MDESSVEDINDNLGAVTFIMLARIYDMLAIIADGVGKGEDALRLLSLHKSGELMSPPPSLNLEMNSDEPTEE